MRPHALCLAVVLLLPSLSDAAPLPPGAILRLGEPRQRISGRLCLVAFSADGKRLVAAAGERSAYVWDWPLAGPPRTLESLSEGGPLSMALAPDGRTLATGSSVAGLLLRDIETGKVRQRIDAHRGATLDVVYAADGQRLATVGADTVVRVWTDGGVASWQVRPPDARAQCLALAGDRLLAGCDDGVIRVWDLTRGDRVRELDGHAEPRVLAVSADGAALYGEGSDHVINRWDLASGRVVQTFAGHTAPIRALVCSADRRRLAATDIEHGVRIWDVDSGEELGRLSEDRTAASLAFAPDGRLVVATPEGMLSLWDVDRLKRTALLPDFREEVEALGFAADGKSLQTWGASESLRWDLATGRFTRTTAVGRPKVENVLTSPNGKYRVNVDRENAPFPILVNLETAKEVPLDGTLRSAMSVAFSRDDKILAAAGSDGNLTLWETITGQMLAEIRAHDGSVNAVVFAPDGKRFATSGGDASVLVWSLLDCGGSLPPGWDKPPDDELEVMWRMLGSARGTNAFFAMRGLIAVPNLTVPLIRKKLPAPRDLKRIKKLVVELDDDDFDVREKASLGLAQAGRYAEQELLKALVTTKSAEVKRRVQELLEPLKGDDSPRLRLWARTVFVLEQIGTPEARDVLKLLVDGDREPCAAEDARSALKRN